MTSVSTFVTIDIRKSSSRTMRKIFCRCSERYETVYRERCWTLFFHQVNSYHWIVFHHHLSLIVLDIRVLVNFKGKPAECESLHRFECPCMFGLRFEHNRERYYKIMEEWNRKVVEVANREEFHDRNVDYLIFILSIISNRLNYF